MNGRIKEHSQINHFERAGNASDFSSKSRKPVLLQKVVALNQMRFYFCSNRIFMWYKITINAVTIAKKDLEIQFFQSLVHFSKGFRISCATFPIDELFCGSAVDTPDPNSSFFERKKCHISSSSITTLSSIGAGLE